MTDWKKRQNYENSEVDFSLLEGILSQIALNLAEPEHIDKNKKLLLGFSMAFDESGNPRIESFGTIKPINTSHEKNIPLKPLIEINELKDQIDITVEMKTIEPERLKFQVVGKKIIFSIPGERPFYKLVRLNSAVYTQPMKKFYNNGILELSFKKSVMHVDN
jgi:HSP20 family molecular chaperone IbpA